MYQRNKLPAFEGVSGGNTATVRLPIGWRYHYLYLAYSGVTLAQMTEIRVKANGRVIHRYSPTSYNVINRFDGRATANGIYTIAFNRYGLLDRVFEEMSALLTGINAPYADGSTITQVEVEIDIDAAAAAPALQLYSDRSLYNPNQPYFMRTIETLNRDMPLGTKTFQDIPESIPLVSPTKAVLGRLFMRDLGNLIDIKIRRDTREIFGSTRVLSEMVQADGVRVPQANWFAVDPSRMGYGGEAFDVAGYQQWEIETNASAAVPGMEMIVEWHGALAA